MAGETAIYQTGCCLVVQYENLSSLGILELASRFQSLDHATVSRATSNPANEKKLTSQGGHYPFTQAAKKYRKWRQLCYPSSTTLRLRGEGEAEGVEFIELSALGMQSLHKGAMVQDQVVGRDDKIRLRNDQVRLGRDRPCLPRNWSCSILNMSQLFLSHPPPWVYGLMESF